MVITTTRIPNVLDTYEVPAVTDENCLTVDFGPYAASHPFDIVVENKNYHFQAHKEILANCSSVFKDMIEGDAEIEKIPMADISDYMLGFLKDLIYLKDRAEVPYSNEVACDKQLMVLASKYDLVMANAYFLHQHSDKYYPSAKRFEEMLNFAQLARLDDIAQVIFNQQQQSFPTAIATNVIKHYTTERFEEFFNNTIVNPGTRLSNEQLPNLMKYVESSPNRRGLQQTIQNHVSKYPTIQVHFSKRVLFYLPLVGQAEK